MKQFRKWWSDHRASSSPHTQESARGENLAMLADEEIWRASLEFVREVIATQLKTTSFDDNVNCVLNIQNDIEAELGMCRKVESGDGNGYRLICMTCKAKEECQKMTDKVQNETKTE